MPSSEADGRDRIPWNVLTSWSGQLVQIVSGFILPRMIDGQLGPLQLGVWDFAWSMVTSFTLLQAGVVSSVNRYVALYRAQHDDQNVNRVVSSVTCILCIMGLLVVLLALGGFWGIAYFLDTQFAHTTYEAQWLVLLLGLRMAIHVASSAFGGVLTGCHRWDLHNAVFIITNVIMLTGSIAALTLGYGLIGLAVVNLCSETLGRVMRWVMAHRVCPELRLRWQDVHWQTARTLLGFGAKNFVPRLGQLFLHQAVNLLILAHLGPIALALYARPRALLRHVMTVIQKYAHIFVPTVSSLQGSGHQRDIYDLAINATRYGACISLPLILLLALNGGDLLQVWMGEPYRQAALIAILALGHFTQIAFMPLLNILAGLNQHGRPGVANLLAASLSLLLVYVALQHTQWGLLGVALAVGLPLTVANGLYLPLYACRVLGRSVRHFFIQSWYRPLVCSLPFTCALLFGKWVYHDAPARALICGLSLGSVSLVISYWVYIVPKHWKKKLVVHTLGVVGHRLP